MNLFRIIIEGGWVIEEHILDKFFELSGVSNVIEKYRKRLSTAGGIINH